MARLFSLLAILAMTMVLLAQGGAAQDSGTSYAPASPDAETNIPAHRLSVQARLVEDGDTIERGLVWRIFDDRPGEDSRLPLIASGKGGSMTFSLPPGTYLVHGAFGRAGATKRINIGSSNINENFVLEAGGLVLNAVSGSTDVAPRSLRFSIYEVKAGKDGNRKLIAKSVPADHVIRLNAGTYHVLSRYGSINATVRADLEVRAGQVTQSVLQHRAAPINLKLVSVAGGDPVANTAWTVLTEDGEKVFESTNVSPSLVLAEGNYEAIVRNGPKIQRQDFTVAPGALQKVELLLN